jgi:hypothetical protein
MSRSLPYTDARAHLNYPLIRDPHHSAIGFFGDAARSVPG